MKKITTTHIDTGSHGYYSVSKKDIEYLGISDKISGFSGHTLNRVYLEEDCDAMLLYNRAEEMGVEVIRKCGFNLNFNIKHNYKPNLFGWVPLRGQDVMVGERKYTIADVTKSKLIVVDGIGTRYWITKSNPFKYIDAVL
jgi:hypothetical protein